MQIREILDKLCGAAGGSGFEADAAAVCRACFAPYVDEIYSDALGNVIAHRRTKRQGAPRLMLDAHLDEIGLIVTSVDEKGFLHVTNVGGVDARILPGQEVVVHGRQKACGVIGLRPPHLQEAGEADKTLSIDELTVDIGMDEAAAREVVRAGDLVTFLKRGAALAGGQYTSASLDNRAGVAALLYAAAELNGRDIGCDIYYVLSVCEETSMAGARTSTHAINPDYALVIDVTHGITPDNREDAFACGKGPAYTIGPNVSRPLTDMMCEAARAAGVQLHAEVSGGSSGTNAWAVQVSRLGVACAVLSIPLKYMHTPAETLAMRDIADTGRVAAQFAARIATFDRARRIQP